MNFPTDALLTLLKFARGHVEFSSEVFDAGIEVLKYIYEMVSQKLVGAVPGETEFTPEQVIEAILAQHVVADKHRPELNGSGLVDALSIEDAHKIEEQLSSDVKGFGPGLWLSLGLFILEVVLKKVIK